LSLPSAPFPCRSNLAPARRGLRHCGGRARGVGRSLGLWPARRCALVPWRWGCHCSRSLVVALETTIPGRAASPTLLCASSLTGSAPARPTSVSTRAVCGGAAGAGASHRAGRDCRRHRSMVSFAPSFGSIVVQKSRETRRWPDHGLSKPTRAFKARQGTIAHKPSSTGRHHDRPGFGDWSRPWVFGLGMAQTH